VASLIIAFYHGFQLNKITAYPGGNYPANWALAPASNPFYGILMEMLHERGRASVDTCVQNVRGMSLGDPEMASNVLVEQGRAG